MHTAIAHGSFHIFYKYETQTMQADSKINLKWEVTTNKTKHQTTNNKNDLIVK